MSKKLLFDDDVIQELAEKFPTPIHVYSEAGIEQTAKSINQIFDWADSYCNYFALKATPNPHILEILKHRGMGADASSGPEVEIAKAVGLGPGQIMFSSNNTSADEYKEAFEAGAIINLDDVNQIDVLKSALDGKFPDTISFRYNPGKIEGREFNTIIGKPSDAKFGLPEDQLNDGLKRARDLGVKSFGLHTMMVSNELDEQAHIQTARMLFDLALSIYREIGIKIEFINLGGGFGVNYHPDDKPLDYSKLKAGYQQVYSELIQSTDLHPIRLMSEHGRHITGPNGIIISKVQSIKETHNRYVGLDASMSDLMRPGLYDAYHHISVLGKEDAPKQMQRVVGSLCENNDHFTGKDTLERELPVMEVGDIVVIHDTGAHGHAMGFNYNGKLRAAEILVRADGSFEQIRRRESRDDLFATLSYKGLNK